MKEEPPGEIKEPSPQRVQYYQDRAEQLLSLYGREFSIFSHDLEQLVSVGDELIKTFETTGFNILRKIEDMPLGSRKPLIFYTNYAGRPRHFGRLLAEVE